MCPDEVPSFGDSPWLLFSRQSKPAAQRTVFAELAVRANGLAFDGGVEVITQGTRDRLRWRLPQILHYQWHAATEAPSRVGKRVAIPIWKLPASDVLVVQAFVASRQVNLTNGMIGQTISHYHIVEKAGGGVSVA